MDKRRVLGVISIVVSAIFFLGGCVSVNKDATKNSFLVASPEDSVVEKTVDTEDPAVDVEPIDVADSTVPKEPEKIKEGGERILLTPENISEYNSPDNQMYYDENFNGEVPDELVNYYSKEMGISVDIPYNENWGSRRFELNPYDYYEYGRDDLVGFLNFGPMYRFEAGTWVRAYYLYFYPAQTVDGVMMEKSELNPEKIEINGLTVVKFIDFGMCSYPSLYVIGEKYDYEFMPQCSVDEESDFEFLEEIVSSVKLID
ncbi:MAG: hypothetical protein ABIH78_03870 [Candidatus Peregrinibacteria bacterium]